MLVPDIGLSICLALLPTKEDSSAIQWQFADSLSHGVPFCSHFKFKWLPSTLKNAPGNDNRALISRISLSTVSLYIIGLQCQSSGWILTQTLQGSHLTWITWNSVIYFSRPGKCLEFAQNVGKMPGILTQNLGGGGINSIGKFCVSRCHLQNKPYLHFYHIYIINTHTDFKSN